MKKSILILFFISAVFLFNTCALEIANVIGPDGGYVFYDKGSYTYGWRYIQCSSYDFDQLEGNVDINEIDMVKSALMSCVNNNAEHHKFSWELPTKAQLSKMLECFSYGLTKFSSDFYYLAVDNLYDAGSYWVCNDHAPGIINHGFFCFECGEEAPDAERWVKNEFDPPSPDKLKDSSSWRVVILHKNFDKAANGVVEEVKLPDLKGSINVRVRAIRRF